MDAQTAEFIRYCIDFYADTHSPYRIELACELYRDLLGDDFVGDSFDRERMHHMLTPPTYADVMNRENETFPINRTWVVTYTVNYHGATLDYYEPFRNFKDALNYYHELTGEDDDPDEKLCFASVNKVIVKTDNFPET